MSKIFSCDRCKKEFHNSDDLIQHLERRKIPCDRVCQKCGLKLGSDSSFRRHLAKPCQPQSREPSVTIRDITMINGDHNNINNINNIDNSVNVVVNNNNNIVMSADEVSTFRISKMGIYPIEQEQNKLLEVHLVPLYEIFKNHLNRALNEENINTDDNLRKVLVSIIELFHSNKNTPEYMNIIEGEPGSNNNWVYSATAFVDDIMPKLIRNKRVLQLILQQLENYNKIQIHNNPRIRQFVTEVFIPYIHKLYKHDDIPAEMQMCWQNNKHVLEMINYRQYPKFPLDVMTYTSMNDQFVDYRRRDAEIMEKIRIQNDIDIKQLHKEAIRRVSMQNPPIVRF